MVVRFEVNFLLEILEGGFLVLGLSSSEARGPRLADERIDRGVI